MVGAGLDVWGDGGGGQKVIGWGAGVPRHLGPSTGGSRMPGSLFGVLGCLGPPRSDPTAAPRGPARERGPPLRAGLLHPTPAPEGGRNRPGRPPAARAPCPPGQRRRPPRPAGTGTQDLGGGTQESQEGASIRHQGTQETMGGAQENMGGPRSSGGHLQVREGTCHPSPGDPGVWRGGPKTPWGDPGVWGGPRGPRKGPATHHQGTRESTGGHPRELGGTQ